MLKQHQNENKRIVDPKLIASKLLSSALQHNWSEQVEVSADKIGSNVSSAPIMDSPRDAIQGKQKQVTIGSSQQKHQAIATNVVVARQAEIDFNSTIKICTSG